jgi:hypothetical protein
MVGTDESNVEQMQAERTRLFMVPPPILANHIKNAMVRVTFAGKLLSRY